MGSDELKGNRVKLIRMEDPYTKLLPGSMGTIKGVDGIGQIMVSWDDGSSLSLIPEIDEYQIEESQRFKHLKSYNEKFFVGGDDKNWLDDLIEYDNMDGVELKSWDEVHSNGEYVNFTFEQLKELSVFFGLVSILMAKKISNYSFKMKSGFGKPKVEISGIIYSHATCLTLNLVIKRGLDRDIKWYKFRNVLTLIDFLKSIDKISGTEMYIIS